MYIERRTVWGVMGLFAALTLAACGGDDSVPPVDGGRDGAALTDGGLPSCEGIGDGASCGDGFICISGACVPTQCGDGYVDTTASEECDDGNIRRGDGCEPLSCTFSCADDTGCDDSFACNGTETCDTAMHRCTPGLVVPDGTMCMLPDAGGDGTCVSGLCAPPNCGDSDVDTGEECDDGQNGDQDDGCRDDCTFTCDGDADCADADACNGDEVCDDTDHTCSAGTALDCDDSDACSADSCDVDTGCANVLVDVDLDGYSTATCGSGSPFMGGDCDDDNSSIYPGAAELCDGLDNDCNEMVDDGTVSVTCLRDQDGDGYGDMTMSMSGCSCPAGYIPPRADTEVDCEDVGAVAASINPGQMTYFGTGYCPGGTPCALTDTSFDYDCDGAETQRWTTASPGLCTLDMSGTTPTCTGDGWITTVPECGALGMYRVCLLVRIGMMASCSGSLGMSRRQTCR